MAVDEYGNEIPEQRPQFDWNEATNVLNRYNSDAKGGNINWDAARAAFDKSAAQGGNFGDVVNRTWDARSSWAGQPQGITANPGAAAPAVNPYDYEKFREGWLTAGFGGKTSRDELAQHAAKWGVTLKNEKAYDPQGRFIADMIGDVDGKNTRIFLRGTGGKAAPKGKIDPNVGGKGGISPGGPKLLPPGTPGSGTPGGPMDPGGSVAPVQDPRLTELYNTLLARSKQGLAVDKNDPAIRQQTDAYAAQEERARRNYLSDLAESEGPLANLRGEQRMAAERMGQNVGNMEAGLIGRELTARREEIQNALTQTQGLLTMEQQMALQKELTLIDDATKRLGINNQNSQFYAGMKEQARQFNKELEYKNRALAQQSRSEADRLGFQYDSLEWIKNPANPANRL